MLGDPNFDRTVVLMVEHNEDGALGIVLNRPTDLPLLDALPDWAGLASEPAVLHVGGPVEERSGWCLPRPPPPDLLEGFGPHGRDLALPDPSPPPAAPPPPLTPPRPTHVTTARPPRQPPRPP